MDNGTSAPEDASSRARIAEHKDGEDAKNAEDSQVKIRFRWLLSTEQRYLPPTSDQRSPKPIVFRDLARISPWPQHKHHQNEPSSMAWFCQGLHLAYSAKYNRPN